MPIDLIETSAEIRPQCDVLTPASGQNNIGKKPLPLTAPRFYAWRSNGIHILLTK